MRCNECGYVLWNLRERTCPECGTAFRPSERTFRRMTVRYCCPHCDQAYHGHDANGHLHPRAFRCVNCGHDVEMDEMVLRPESGHDSESAAVGRMPWLHRGDGSAVKSWFRTLGLAMVEPVTLIRGVPPSTAVWPPLRFMAATIAIFLLVGTALPNLLLYGVMGGMAAGPWTFGATAVMSFGAALVGWISTVAAAIAWILLTHWFVLILGGTAPLRQTTHCVGYGSAASGMLVIPCGCVSIGGTIWWIVSASIMIREVHRVSVGRAAAATVSAAVLSFTLAFLPLTLALYAGMFVGLAGIPGLAPGLGPGFGGANFGTVRPVDEQVAFLRDTLRDAAADRGAMPNHVLELFGDALGPDDFSTADAPDPGIRVGATPLRGLPFDLDGTVRRQVVDGELADDPIAYRVGRFVFTHIGVRPGDPPELWLVVAMPPSTRPTGRATAEIVVVGTLGGELVEFPLSELAERVDEQNEVRRGVGLEQLPPALTPMPYTPPR